MAKFEVGEIVVLLAKPNNFPEYEAGDRLEVLAVPGYKTCPCCHRLAGNTQYYSVKKLGVACASCPEEKLGKLPPDDHTQDTTEDPGLTRIKKLLQQDLKPTTKPIKEPS